MAVKFTISGPDAEIIEPAARALCYESGGNCFAANPCKSRALCRVEGWATYTDDVETVLKAIREKHRITRK